MDRAMHVNINGSRFKLALDFVIPRWITLGYYKYLAASKLFPSVAILTLIF